MYTTVRTWGNRHFLKVWLQGKWVLPVFIRLAKPLHFCRIDPSPYVGIKVEDIKVVCW